MSEALFTTVCPIYCLIGLAFVLDVPDVPGQSDAEILTRWLLVALFWPVVAILKVRRNYTTIHIDEEVGQ